MNGVTFMVWSAVLFLAFSFWFVVFDSLMETISDASNATIAQFFAAFATVILLTAVVGWFNAAIDLYQTGRERIRTRRSRWPH